MDTAEAQLTISPLPPSGRYGLGPPWLFRGRALYQLHLVKAEVARPFVPKELKLVEAFGYTLGGLFLAQYEDSPAGAFDELMIIAGIVWNPPTSCAWAARVLVNSYEACRHGREEVGLPSHVAVFSKRNQQASWEPLGGRQSFLNKKVISSIFTKKTEHSEIVISEMRDTSVMSVCNIRVPLVGDGWAGPMIRMSFPSFSGQTMHNPHLLKYSCQIACRMRAVPTAKISRTHTSDQYDNREEKQLDASLSAEDEAFQRSVCVLLSKPILALDFSHLKMQVEAPNVVTGHPLFRTSDVGDAKTLS